MSWITDRLPEDTKPVLGCTASGQRIVVQYTKGGELICYDEDPEPGQYDKGRLEDELYLKEGWYSLEEQYRGDTDEHYFKRQIAYWQPLP